METANKEKDHNCSLLRYIVEQETTNPPRDGYYIIDRDNTNLLENPMFVCPWSKKHCADIINAQNNHSLRVFLETEELDEKEKGYVYLCSALSISYSVSPDGSRIYDLSEDSPVYPKTNIGEILQSAYDNRAFEAIIDAHEYDNNIESVMLKVEEILSEQTTDQEFLRLCKIIYREAQNL